MRLIKATALSKILGKSTWFIRDYFTKKYPIGIIINNGIAYYNIEFAKEIACQISYQLKKTIEEILEEIDNYRP
ncbi:hypothetical protein [Geminocystis sp. NIES-3709]|uniref:hypothetical protein n=1 Tax=Geminocystis sp. NIES-3709 TaxID=1617448 RepID=UPI0005FC6EDD|nr:hypothetical protein [Geminocystis sp. NIES-3709]BAQ67072.1 hypothetical protein GM3709_3837 [Geminocystis sp. NIES-3709]